MGIFNWYSKNRKRNVQKNEAWLKKHKQKKAKATTKPKKNVGKKLAVKAEKIDTVMMSDAWGFTGFNKIMDVEGKQAKPKRVTTQKASISVPVVKQVAPGKSQSSYVIVSRTKNPSVKKYGVKYKSSSLTKYNRRWFNTYQEANAFGKSVAKQYESGVTYEDI